MGTVTYKNQPGIEATKGKIPLAGTKHLYTVNKRLWPDEVEQFLNSKIIGKCLHVCCGKSQIGDYRLDINEAKVDVRADAAKLPFKDNAISTILCDPPYNGKLQWNHDVLSELARVAYKRIIFQHWFIPINSRGDFKKSHKWELRELYLWQPKTYFGRVQVISIIDPCLTEQTELKLQQPTATG
jgi:ubiquinone/menaquinone biosynthesis C-methylase UbiE